MIQISTSYEYPHNQIGLHSVDNPNFFSATFSSIVADATYPVGNVSSIGGGNLTNVEFKSHTTTELAFPFIIDYQLADDPNFVIAQDLANKCGFLPGSTKTDIKVNYKLRASKSYYLCQAITNYQRLVMQLKIRILAQISPDFSSSATFACPLTKDQLAVREQCVSLDFPFVLILDNQGLGDISKILGGGS